MSESDEGIRERVLRIMPEQNIARFDVNQEGLINDVAIVNDALVFRFAKTEEYARILRSELHILDLVRPNVAVPVPEAIRCGEDYIVYRLLEGEPLTRRRLLGLEDRVKERLVEQLGRFLYGLHTIDISAESDLPCTLAPVTRERWEDIRSRVEAKVYPLLLPHQREWAQGLFDSMLGKEGAFEYMPALIHGDLASYHILFDPACERIGGVIDFGVAGVGDPALDLGNLITTYGERFVGKMSGAYPDFDALLPRARFYAQAIELQWVLNGLELGEVFWFTAHLGGARDLLM